ncbi:MAG: carboxypeptidase-like regulatory domain-containing protein [Steroidobacteraceae bacterium]
MNKSHITAFFLALLCVGLARVAFCSDITGEVIGPQGPVAGAQITVTDSGGNVVGQATTNDAGRYCITGLSPGNYKTAVNPPASAGFNTGTANNTISVEGMTEDWSLSSATLASSSANTPGVCGAAYLGAYVGGILGVATGAGLGACAAEGCFSGAPSPAVPVVSSSK